MKQFFFITYTSKLDINTVAEIIEKEFNITFDRRKSYFLHDYLKYSGGIFDRLVIKSNIYSDGCYIDNAEICSIIEFSFLSGRNKDKNNNFLNVKEKLVDCSEVLEFYSERILIE